MKKTTTTTAAITILLVALIAPICTAEPATGNPNDSANSAAPVQANSVPARADEPVDLLASGGFRLNKHWEVKDGILGSSKTPGGILWSKQKYGDFQITLDYKTSQKCNSGLFFRSDPRNPVQGGFEIQIASDGLYKGKHVVGSLYDAQPPAQAAGKPDGQWNTMTLTCQGPHLTVVLNGQQVLDANIDDWTTPHKNPDGSKNKFKTALKDLPRTGHLGLQYHGQPIWFRNIQIATVAQSTPAEQASQAVKIKNILFLISDDLKASALPAYGNAVCKTPNLDRLAASGVVFERAYCQGLACAPSRPSFMRSIYPRSRVTAPTIGEHLQTHGLHTARVGKIFHMPVPDAPKNGTSGLDVPACWTERHNTQSAETFTPGLYRLTNKGIVTRKLEGRQGARTRGRPWTSVEADQEDGSDQADHMVATKAIELLRQRKAKGKPFFLGVGFFRPHYPMVAPKKYFDMYPQETMEIPPLIPGDLDDIPQAGRGSDGKGLNETEEGRRRMWQAYYASVSFMDEQLGRVIDELDRLGLRDSTAIVFTTDHGYHLGEHGFWQKANLHEEVVRVPFMVSAPGIKPGRTSSLVELVDFYPTCTDLLGLPTPKGLHGKSLAPILRDPQATVRDTALSLNIRKSGGAIRAATWHYLNYGGEGEELYDMQKDPHQYTNVVDDHAYAGTLKEARAKYKLRMKAAELAEKTNGKRKKTKGKRK